MKRRIEVVVKGEVQKVGYRDSVQKIARSLEVRGYVENLRDGNVFIVCEGEDENVNKFVEEIDIKKHFIHVKEVEITKESDYTGEFEYFDIKYGKLEEELGERMGTGIAYAGATLEETKATRQDIKAMHEDLNEGFKGMHEELKEGFKGTQEGINSMHEDIKEGFKAMHNGIKRASEETHEDLAGGFEGTRKDIQAMHEDMNKNFNELDNKYHSVSKNLEGLNENLTKVVEGLTALIKDHIEKDKA